MIKPKGGNMDIKTVRFLAEYNRIANEKMNALIRTLDDGQWTRKFGGYFSSIRSLCNHLYISDFNWLKRFSLLRSFEYIKDELFLREIKFGDHAIESREEYLKNRVAMDIFLKSFAGEITEQDLGMNLRYKDSRGGDHDQDFGLVILHVFNHQTHHRGMVSIYLEEMGIENDYSNIMDIL
jgi:uncharacterized damage-inducible protein DinB